MIAQIPQFIESIVEECSALDFFVFGSMLTRADPADLDLLVVYEDESDLHEFLDRDDVQVGQLPLDVTAMTPTELEGSTFLVRSGAIKAREFVGTQLRVSDSARS